MDNNKFKEDVLRFLIELRTKNNINEGLYDSISDQILLQRNSWAIQKSVPIEIFEACIDLISALSGGNRFLSENDQERLEDIGDEIYGALMGFE